MSIQHRVAWVGLVLGPLLALVAYLALPETLGHAGRMTAAVGVWMATWWMTEAIPLPATALLPVVMFPLSGAMSVADTLRPYASDIVFLFMGGFMLGLAMQRWDLHRRIALRIVRLVGTTPSLLVAGFMLATAALSMWISNTAATVMLLPVGMSVVVLLKRHVAATLVQPFAICLMLGIAYAASIGGLGTPIGSPPNAILVNFAANELDWHITMLDWMKVGLPLIALLLPLTWLYLTRVMFRTTLVVPAAVRDDIRRELDLLGPMSRGERIVAVVFVLTALAWVTRPQLVAITGLPFTDAIIAMTAALALFVIPVNPSARTFALDWETAVQLPWGVLLLFGGGLSLAAAIGTNGVDAWLASGFSGLQGVRVLWVVLAACGLVILLTELASNTAIANTFIPILAAAAIGLGIDPIPVLFAAALAASCAFMLPVATPPNAIVFASGEVTIGQMMRAGAGLNLIAVLAITLVITVAS